MFSCQQYSSGSGPFSQNSPPPLPPSLVVVLVFVVVVVVVALFVVVEACVGVVLVCLVFILFVVLIVVVGQALVLQCPRLVLYPTHLRPPFCALFLTLLVEIWRPPPQVFVHDAHLPHCPHWQSTEREKHVLLSLFYFEPN